MSARDNLAALILAALHDGGQTESAHAWVADWGSLDSQPIDGNVNLLAVADAIIAAGWTPPPPHCDHDWPDNPWRNPWRECRLCGKQENL
jgi:hypothetical protein